MKLVDGLVIVAGGWLAWELYKSFKQPSIVYVPGPGTGGATGSGGDPTGAPGQSPSTPPPSNPGAVPGTAGSWAQAASSDVSGVREKFSAIIGTGVTKLATSIGGSAGANDNTGGGSSLPSSPQVSLPEAATATQPVSVRGNQESTPFQYPWKELAGASARSLSRAFGGADKVWIEASNGWVKTLDQWIHDSALLYANDVYNRVYNANKVSDRTTYIWRWNDWMDGFLASWIAAFDGKFLPKLAPPAVWPEFPGLDHHDPTWEFAFYKGAWWVGEYYKDASGIVVRVPPWAAVAWAQGHPGQAIPISSNPV